MRPLGRVMAVAFLAALAAPAQAGDGRLEINQSCAASGCFVGDTPGLPVNITASGSYVLTSSLSAPDANTHGVVIEADDVSLDLNGFTIAGPVVCTGEPVTSCAPSGSGSGIFGYGDTARIHGGAVRGFGSYGVYAGTDARLFDLLVAHNGGVGVFLSRGGSLRDGTVNFNGSTGVASNAGGGFGELAGSTVRGNKGDGASFSAGLIVDSRFQNNGLTGITGSAAAGRNVLTGNAGASQISAATDVIACNQVSGTAVCPP